MDKIYLIRKGQGHTVVFFENGWSVCSCPGGLDISNYDSVPNMRTTDG